MKHTLSHALSKRISKIKMISTTPKILKNILQSPDRFDRNCHDNITRIASVISPQQFTEYFKFGFVRNPWDRTVSLYERKKKRVLAQKKETSFEEFVESAKYASSTCIRSQFNRYQLDWFLDYGGNIRVDFIGRYERLEEDWATIARKLGIDTPLLHENESVGRRHYTEYYDRKTKDIIATRFAVDIDYFEYEFGK